LMTIYRSNIYLKCDVIKLSGSCNLCWAKFLYIKLKF